MAGSLEATTSPTPSPIITCPIATGSPRCGCSHSRPRMYGSTETNSVRTTASPAPASGIADSRSPKSSTTGTPTGRRANTTCRFVSAVICSPPLMRPSHNAPCPRRCASSLSLSLWSPLCKSRGPRRRGRSYSYPGESHGARFQSIQGDAVLHPLQGERQIRASSAESGEGSSGQPTSGYAEASRGRGLG